MSITALRKFKINDIALFDVLITAVIMAPLFNYFDIPMWKTVPAALPLGIIAHYIFGIDTVLSRQFLNSEFSPAVTTAIVGTFSLLL
jgi:hypothetical protein